MADPCVESNEYIGLDTTGSPAVLEATWLNPETTFSATQGDYTLHDVDDHNVAHTQTQTVVITNGGSAPLRGIVVCGQDPIYVAAIEDIEATIVNELVIGGVTADAGNVSEQGLAMDAVASLWIPVKTLVGEISIAPGGNVTVTFSKTLTNTGISARYTFIMGGDKLVAQKGY